jgi:hypothetical protein
MDNRKLKLNIISLFDGDDGTETEYVKSYTLKLATHDDFTALCTKLHQRGVMQYMIKRFGAISHSTNFSGKYNIVEEFIIYTPLTEELFHEMCLKWEAVLKQHNAL